MLKYRLITAAVLIPLLVLAIWFLPPIPFALFMAVFIMLGAWEWSKLVGITSVVFRLSYVVAITLALFLANWIPVLPMLSIGFLTLLWAAIAIIRYERGQTPAGFHLPELKIIIGMFILVPCWVGLIVLQSGTLLGPRWLLLTLCIIWAADTGAYFAGLLWGKRQLVAKVSPNKTWEGFWGGLGLALLVAVIGSYLLPLFWPQRLFIWLLALLTVLFSVIGDLTVSLLKRMSGVKDTGQVFPGHGGVLDRIDSVMAGVIVFALGLLVI